LETFNSGDDYWQSFSALNFADDRIRNSEKSGISWSHFSEHHVYDHGIPRRFVPAACSAKISDDPGGLQNTEYSNRSTGSNIEENKDQESHDERRGISQIRAHILTKPSCSQHCLNNSSVKANRAVLVVVLYSPNTAIAKKTAESSNR
jgi:hypothetical protein